MKPGLTVLSAVFLWLGLFVHSAMAQDVGVVRSDILVLDPERMFEETQLGRQMRAAHQAERDALETINRDLSAELAAEEQRLTDIRPETSPEEFRELADAFDTRVQQIRRDFERRSRDLERDRERLPIEFLAQVDEIVLELMRESDGVVLLDLRTVILRADVIDITDRAIDRIDAAFDTGAPSDNSARQE